MSLTLTQTAFFKSLELRKEPQLVLEIDGVSTKYGIGTVLKYVRIGDPGLLIDGSWVIGGYNSVSDQSDLITFDGTTSTLTQQLQPDRATGSSITSMVISLQDRDNEITELISPGIVVTDILGRKAKVWLMFAGTAFPEDAILIHKGIIDDVVSKAGVINLNIAHPDQKKRQQVMVKADTNLNGAIDSSVTTITVDSTSNFLSRVLGPDGAYDSSILFYVQIDDEVIQYVGLSGTQFTSCVRGALGTTAAAHDDDASVSSFFRLQGDALTLALKLMLSGWDGYFKTGVDVTHFNFIGPIDTVANSMFFYGVDLALEYGLVSGDYLTTTGALNGANNVTLKTIDEITKTDDGTYVTINGVTFVDEANTAGTVSFRSKYDTLGAGIGVKMSPDEVDVEQHEYLRRLFLSSFNLDLYVKDTVTAKDFIEKQMYLPAACFSLPRKTRSSVGYHIGPIPGSETKILDDDNVRNASKLAMRRTINRNFYNTVVFQFDVESITDRFLSGRIVTDATSKTQIPVGNRTLAIKSDGMRATLGGQSLANSAANRILNRYAFAAEFFERVEVLYGEGFTIEVGDILILDASNLKVSNTETGDRVSPAKFYEVINKSLDIKTGQVSLALTDTAYSTADRYGLMGPASLIKTIVSTSQFNIEESFGDSGFDENEYLKWDNLTLCSVRVRSPDSVARNAVRTIQNVSGNTITLSSALPFTPLAGDIMELASYSTATDQVKLLYGFMTDAATFADGKPFYRML